MQLKLTYNEVQKMIASKSGKELPMCFGGPHTLRISHKVPLMGSVGLDINVDRIEGSDVILSFGGGAAIEYMLRAALSQAKNQPGGDMVEMLGGNQLLLALGKNPNTSALFQNIQLQDIHFDEQSIMIDFVPKA
ncbi:MAG: hypothetical protein MJZ99_02985 [Bacteroidales bacterium]|nr:hypothetical protein [Candidatus Colimorpha merdihippi]MCQ2281573.1 hypothetical protein [Bacteroidales bacterium]